MDCQSVVNIRRSGKNLNGNVTVKSTQKTSGSDFDFGSFELTVSKDNKKLGGTFTTMAQALVFTAGAGALTATASTANAISDATSRALVRAEQLTAVNIEVTNNAESTAAANIGSIGFGLTSALVWPPKGSTPALPTRREPLKRWSRPWAVSVMCRPTSTRPG